MLRLLFLGTLCCMVWGLSVPFVKVIVTEIHPFTTLFIRTSIAAIVLFPFFPKPPAPLRLLFPLAMIFTLGHLGLFFLSLYEGMSASMAAVLEQVNIPILMLAGVVLYKEKVSPLNIFGVILSILGIYWLYNAPDGLYPVLSYVYVFGAAFTWALYSLLLKQLPTTNSFQVVIWIAILSAPVLGLLSILFFPEDLQSIGSWSTTTWTGLLYLGIISQLLGHGIWAFLMQRYSASKVAPFSLLVPLFGVLGGLILLDEFINGPMAAAMAVTLVGVTLSQLRPRRKQTHPKTQELLDNVYSIE